MGIAGAFELTARNKYCSLLVEDPEHLAVHLASFSVVFNVGKLVGPPIGGWLVALAGPAWALGIDAASYLLPIASVMFCFSPGGTWNNAAWRQRCHVAEGMAGLRQHLAWC